VPKLLFCGIAGVAIKEAEVARCREHLSNLDLVDLGDAIHFVQETHPETIGAELSPWCARLQARLMGTKPGPRDQAVQQRVSQGPTSSSPPISARLMRLHLAVIRGGYVWGMRAAALIGSALIVMFSLFHVAVACGLPADGP
jgi:hypothetical protein